MMFFGLDMVEVGGSNPPGPTKIKSPPLDGSFSFEHLLQMCFGQLHQPFSHNAQKP